MVVELTNNIMTGFNDVGKRGVERAVTGGAAPGDDITFSAVGDEQFASLHKSAIKRLDPVPVFFTVPYASA